MSEENKKNNKFLIEKVVKVEKKDNLYLIKFDEDLDSIPDEELLNLINEDYEIIDFLGSGKQAEIKELKNDKVARISTKSNKIKKLDRYIEKNNNILSNLNGIKAGSTIPINSFIILDKNEKFKTIEILKKREKGDLNKLRKNKKITSVSLIEQMIKVVKNEHIAGIIHRDIKSLNILIDKNNKLTFSDFGLSNNVYKKEIVGCGTLLYAAPELIKRNLKSNDISQKNDIYSLGITFLEEFLSDNNFYNIIFPYYDNFRKSFRAFFRSSKKCFLEFINQNDVTKFIKKDNIDFDNFLPKDIVDNDINTKNIDKLKEKILKLIKHMIAKNPKKRATIFEVEKEFDNIKKFMLNNLKKGDNSNITTEDFLFLKNKNLIEPEKQEIIKNKRLYELKAFNNNTINVKINSFKKSLGKLLERQIKQDDKELKNKVLWELKENESNKDKNLKELSELLKNISVYKEQLSYDSLVCINHLNNCIDENKNIKLPDKYFYELLYNNLKDNVTEQLIVTEKLSELRELKLSIEIKELEKLRDIFGSNNKNLEKNIEKYRELYNDIKIITRINGDSNIIKHLFVSKNLKNKEIELQNMDKMINNTYIDIICKEQKKNPELLAYLFNNIRERKEYNNILVNLFYKSTKFNYKNLFKELLKEPFIDEIIDLISKKEGDNIEIALILLNKIKNDKNKYQIILNKIFNKSIENNNLFVINKLIKNCNLKLDFEKLDKYINTICKNKNIDLNVINTLLNSIENNQKLHVIAINNMFNEAYEKNDVVIKTLLNSNNIEKFINLIYKKPKLNISLFAPISIICNYEDKYSELFDNFIKYILEKNNCSEILNKLFDIAYQMNCPNIIERLLKKKKVRKIINLNKKIINKHDLVYDSLICGKDKIFEILVKYGARFNIKGNGKVKIIEGEKELFNNFKIKLQEIAEQHYQNVDKIKNIEIKQKNYIFSKKTKYNYIDENDFKEINCLLNSLGEIIGISI